MCAERYGKARKFVLSRFFCNFFSPYTRQCGKSDALRLRSRLDSRRPSLQAAGSNWRDLITVDDGETAGEVVARLFRQAGHQRGRAERGIVFLDFLDSTGSRAMDYGEDPDRVAREIVRVLLGEQCGPPPPKKKPAKKRKKHAKRRKNAQKHLL